MSSASLEYQSTPSNWTVLAINIHVVCVWFQRQTFEGGRIELAKALRNCMEHITLMEGIYCKVKLSLDFFLSIPFTLIQAGMGNLHEGHCPFDTGSLRFNLGRVTL